MSDTPHYQAIMDAVATVFAQEQSSPGSVPLAHIRELSVMARTVMPNMTAADIAALGNRKFEALSILYAASDTAINDLATLLKAEINTLSTDVQTAISTLHAGSENSINALYLAKAALLETLASDKTTELTGIIDTAKLAALDTISAAEAAALANIGGSGVDRGILIADFARYQQTSPFSYTSHLGQTYLSSSMNRLFKMLLGMGDSSYHVRNNRIPRQILPVSKGSYNVGIAQHYSEYPGSSNQYNYPTFNIAALFLKNPTGSAINTTIYNVYSSYWGSGYEGAQLFTVTPNVTDDDRANMTALAYSQLWTVQASHVTSKSQAVTVPANKTIAVVLACTDHYFTSSSGYQYQKEFGFYNLQVAEAAGLVIDDKTLEAAWGRNHDNDFDAWKHAA